MFSMRFIRSQSDRIDAFANKNTLRLRRRLAAASDQILIAPKCDIDRTQSPKYTMQ